MVVDDVEQHAEAKTVRAVHEATEIVRPAVEVSGCEEIDAVITPPEPSSKLSHGHHLDRRDPDIDQRRQMIHGRPPRSLLCERANVKLVKHLPSEVNTLPRVVSPLEGSWIDDL